MDDELLLLRREGAAFKVRPEVVNPAEAAALAAALEAGIPGDVAPTALPIVHHVIHQLIVFLRRPQPLSELATGGSNVGVGADSISSSTLLRLPHCRRRE